MQKRFFLCLALFLFASLCQASDFPNPKKSVRKHLFDLDKSWVLIEDGTYICKYEVTNEQYKEFMLGLVENGTPELVPEFAPDTDVWRRDLAFNDPYAQYYLKHPAFKKYPVVGISHDAALAYCEWLTEEFGNKVEGKSLNGQEAMFEFRLPTEEEWIKAASVNCPGEYWYAGNYFYPRNHKGFFVFNHKLGPGDYAGWAGGKYVKDYEGYMITAPVDEFYSEDAQLYNIAGNVAEMVDKPGIAKGGSWAHLSEECRLNKHLEYEAVQAWLGIRLVIEFKQFIEEKPTASN